MDELRTQVRRAAWRLGLQRFVAVLGWCLTATLLAALALVVIDKFRPLRIIPEAWIGGAVGLGFLAAAVWAMFSLRKPLDAAALEIDRRCGLKERVSTALSLSRQQDASPAGQAVLADARHRIQRVDVAGSFAIRPSRRLLWPLLPAAALLLAEFVPPALRSRRAAGAGPRGAGRRAG